MKENDDQNSSSEKDKGGVSRRDFFRTAAVIGGGVAAFQVLGKGALAQGETKAAAPGAAAGAPSKKAPLKLEQVLKTAREKLYPWCRVCPECDGVACAGEVPGFGGIGSGASFKNNYQSLAAIHLNMRTFHANKKPDTSVTIFGEKLGIPILAAATGGTTYNMGGKIGEEEYIDAILGGCLAGGTIGMVADGIGDPVTVYETRLKILRGYNGKGIAIIKPRTQEEIIKRIKLVEGAGAIAVGIDIDSAGRAARALPGQTVEPKTPAQLRELVKSTKLPFIIKGVMTPDEASMAPRRRRSRYRGVEPRGTGPRPHARSSPDPSRGIGQGQGEDDRFCRRVCPVRYGRAETPCSRGRCGACRQAPHQGRVRRREGRSRPHARQNEE